MSKFSNILKRLRNEKGISQKELGEKFSVSQNAIYNWENGTRDPSYETIEQLANFFEVSPAYLMGWNMPNDSTTLAAHFDGDEYTEEELEEIKQFAEFVKSKRKSD